MKRFSEFIKEDKNKKYGVKDDFDSHQKAAYQEETENKLTDDDKKSLMTVLSNVERGIQVFEELGKFLESFGKISKKPVDTILSSIKSFKESIDSALEKI